MCVNFCLAFMQQSASELNLQGPLARSLTIRSFRNLLTFTWRENAAHAWMHHSDSNNPLAFLAVYLNRLPQPLEALVKVKKKIHFWCALKIMTPYIPSLASIICNIINPKLNCVHWYRPQCIYCQMIVSNTSGHVQQFFARKISEASDGETSRQGKFLHKD